MKTILLDVDGVLRNIADTILKINRELYGGSPYLTHGDLRPYHLHEIMPNVKDINGTFFKKHAMEVFRLSPIENIYNINAVNRMYEKNKIFIVTHQYKDNEQYTIDWLRLHNVNYHKIFFTSDKTTVEGDYLVDDSIEHLNAVRIKREVIPIAYAQPWNEKWNGKRIKTLVELERIVEG